MRIILSTFGSFGDVHPYMAIALELQRRGHVPVIATSELYRAKVEAEGLEFSAVRPDLPPPDEAGPIIEKVMAGAGGPRFLFEEILMPGLRGGYDDLTKAVQGADLMLSHVVSLAAPLVAAKTKIPWISSVLAPISFYSAYDLSVPPMHQSLFALRFLGPRFLTIARTIGVKTLNRWVAPYYELQRELGLPRGANPIIDAHSPRRVLALFSPLLGTPQPDWPPNTLQTGFCFYDKRGRMPGGRVPGASDESFEMLSPELAAFLKNGEPPIVFTLGSSAVFDPGPFYEESARAAQLLGRRAVLLIGDETNKPKHLPDGVATFDYAPYSQIFPRACAIVHQGGVGTTAQAMRAGKPMLIVPFSHDQPDHAYRMKSLGVGLGIARENYHARVVAQKLKWLLGNPSFSHYAAQIGNAIRAENGTQTACDEIENFASKMLQR
ncbi:MAG TPA: nucleotide disphospho-sugar-binding domain-containing protein [Abditibacteriaceae bacterium]